MVGMQTQFGRGRYVDVISNRTIQSGGSVGGVKKAGIVTFGTTWSRGNMGNYLIRAPTTSNPTILFVQSFHSSVNGYAVSAITIFLL